MQTQKEEFCDELNQILADGGQLVDVRTWQEYATGALQGALNVPLHTLPLRHPDLDRTKPVLLYCVSGQRSRQAAHFLSQQGFDEVYNIGAYARLSQCQTTLQ